MIWSDTAQTAASYQLSEKQAWPLRTCTNHGLLGITQRCVSSIWFFSATCCHLNRNCPWIWSPVSSQDRARAGSVESVPGELGKGNSRTPEAAFGGSRRGKLGKWNEEGRPSQVLGWKTPIAALVLWTSLGRLQRFGTWAREWSSWIKSEPVFSLVCHTSQVVMRIK